jgi:hypothetical protein
MSGIFTRPQYDECYSKEYKKMNDPMHNYSFLLDYNVNPNMKPNIKICVQNNEECYTCDLNKEATLDKTPENFMKITEIDNNLKGINMQLTYCNDKKFQGCFNDTEENIITMNPHLCNREITPTNMKKFDNVL